MVMVLGGSGTITGATTFSNNATFSGTLGVTGALTQGSGAPFNLASGRLAFPATQVASSDANTLDDYEEGTFTAYFATGLSIPLYTGTNLYGHASTAPNGRYTKIGRRVYFNFYVYMASSFNYNTGITSSTQAYIGGLPFNAFAGSVGGDGVHTYPACVCGFNFATSWSAAYTPMGIIEPNTNIIRLQFQATNTMNNATAQYWFVGGAGMCWSGHYETNA